AWLVDRRVWRARADTLARTQERSSRARRISGSFARVVLPLTVVVLLLIARAVMRRSGPTFLLDVALPLMLALVAIRVVVYALRQMFRNAAWLKASERSVVLVIWVALILHYTGVLPEFASELDSVDIPLGKGGASLLTLFKGTLVVVTTLIVTLWISGFLEQRLMNAHFDVNLRVVLAKLMRAIL